MPDQGVYDAVLRRAARAGALSDPATFAWVLEPWSSRERQEVAWIAGLSTHARLVHLTEIGRGTRDRVGVDLVDAVGACQREGTRWAVLAHNHPSGDARPSSQDGKLTSAVARACAAGGIMLLDHCVLGRGQVYSFRLAAMGEEPLWPVS